MSNQGLVQAAVRTRSGATGNRSWNEDWLYLFEQEDITGGEFNGLMLRWLNTEMGSSHTTLTGAQQAYAVEQGAYNWQSMTTINAAPPE